MAFFGTLLLVFVVLVRPQEFIPALQSFSLLNLLTAAAVLGIATEIVMGRQGLPWSPQLPWLGGFLAWCFLVTVRQLGVTSGVSETWEFVGLSAIFMVVVTCAVRTVRRCRLLAAFLVAIGTVIACTCIHQSRQPLECIVIDTSGEGGEHSGEGAPDGRSCDNTYICERQGKPHTAYACEKVGLFGTFTVGHRVRWRGTLGDPNELSVAIGATLPFLFAFAASAKRKWTIALCVACSVIALWCIVLTESRGGQLVVVTVFGFYFIKRYGLKGLLIGAILALPVLVLGGRGGEEAESSSLERIGLLYDGMDMVRANPLLGIGTGQFGEYTFNGLTAHNSYVLAAAELGLPGSLLWLMLVYTSMKIPWVIATRPPPGLDPTFVPFAMALVVGFAGITVGIFFLSFCYKAMLFVYFGLSGAMYGAVKRECPAFEVRISGREIARVAAADAAVLVFVIVYSHIVAGSA